MIFEIEHHLWLDVSFQNQNLGENLLAEKTLLEDQRQCQNDGCEWTNDITNNQPIPVAICMKSNCSNLQL